MVFTAINVFVFLTERLTCQPCALFHEHDVPVARLPADGRRARARHRVAQSTRTQAARSASLGGARQQDPETRFCTAGEAGARHKDKENWDRTNERNGNFTVFTSK